MFRKLSFLFEEPRKPMTSLLVPATEGGGYTITSDPDMIFRTLTNMNQTQLRASYCSPFLSGPLSILGHDGFTEHTQQLIWKNTIPDMNLQLTPVETTFLRECGRPVSALTREMFTFKNFKRLASITRESTASSPSGRHYGFYKAALLDTEDDNILPYMRHLQ
jgi:hypothetical protein